MPNILSDGGMEEGTSVLAGLAERVTTQAYEGTHSLLLRTRQGSMILPNGQSSCTWPAMAVVVGETYSVLFRYDGDGSMEADLVLEIDPGLGGVFLEFGRISAPGAMGAWQLAGPYDFTAVGTSAQVRLRSGTIAAAIGNDVWYVDDVQVLEPEAAVAIRLAERAVDAALAQFEASLATELSAIVTERGDSDTLSAPASEHYYNHERREISGGTTHLEVFEGDVEILDEYTDAGNADRVTSSVPLTVRLTAFNRDGASLAVMEDRKRRYACALVKIVVEHPELNADVNIGWSRAGAVLSQVDRDNESNVLKAQITVPVIVRVQETL